MTISEREQEAANAYLRLLQGKGADAETLVRRRALLSVLLPLLAGQQRDGNVYREQVELALQHLERSLWPPLLSVAREYFYFWVGDFKTIAAMNYSGGFDLDAPPASVPLEDLRALWDSLDQERFELAETWPLKAYASALRDEGADKAVVETRSKLVKLLLVRLRTVKGKEASQYRIGVDSTVPLFTMQETRLLFLIVVREFYYFWIGDPDAPSYIALDIQQAES